MAGGCGQSQSERDRIYHDSVRRADSIAAEARAENDLTTKAYAYADSILATMPLERQVAMLLMPAAFSRADDHNIRHILHYTDSLGVGGIVLLKGDLESAAIIADTLASSAGTMPFLAVDAENGLKMRFADAPEFPWNKELGRLSDNQIMYEFGREIARECRLVGINMVLGPVMDVVPGSGSDGLMRKRSFGSDPKRVAELAIAYSRGLEDGNVISVAKHFPGHGSSRVDTHRSLGEIESTREYVDSVDLYPFRRYVEEGLSGVMIGHLAFTALDTIRRPAVISPVIMKDLLRNDLGFHGLVITDALNMEGALGVRAWQAIAAGADMVIAPTDTRHEIQEMIYAVRAGDLPASVIRDRCRRILFYKYLIRSRGREVIPGRSLSESVGRDAAGIRDSLRRR
ncbi:MAG: glycosyl hydrolase family 3 [Muribaculaceae bacterium]|nr:glycosyl hydrolase family 3 [Muribaculaceae bacterium]